MSTEQILEAIDKQTNAAYQLYHAGQPGLALEQLITLRDDLLLALPRKEDPTPEPSDLDRDAHTEG